MTDHELIDAAVERLAAVRIGAWVRRERGRRVSKGHYVDSVVAGDAVTRCGRRMRDGRTVSGVLVVHDGAVSRASRPLDWDLCQGGCTAVWG